jgi:Xaa-Pro aminopeptidase
MKENLTIQQARYYFRTDFPPAEFAARRKKLYDAIGAASHALLRGETGEAGGSFRQAADFFYCCGVEIPGAFLLLSGADRTARLFVPHRPADKHPDEVGLGVEDARMIRRFTGVDKVRGVETLADSLKNIKTLYALHKPAEIPHVTRWTAMRLDKCRSEDPWDGRPAARLHLIALLKTRFPGMDIRELDPFIDKLRGVKSPCEIRVMREAGRLAALAVTEAMRITRPGMVERELSALANRIYLVHGATGEAYGTIVASGRNMQFGHYSRNDAVMKDGDIVLMDGAPDYNYYTSDIGRIWPVNGTYAPWQRELYGFVVEYHKALLSLLRPGAMADDVLKAAAKKMARVIRRTRFSKPIYKAAAQRMLAFKGHLSHPVGLSVHDGCSYRERPLEPGVVLSVDPMTWVPEEELYIRCEDTVVITRNGIENFTAAAPLDLDDVEACMRRGRDCMSVSLRSKG